LHFVIKAGICQPKNIVRRKCGWLAPTIAQWYYDYNNLTIMDIYLRGLVYMMVGMTGEVVYTAVKALIKQKDTTLHGYTQLWVMPLYFFGGIFIFERLHLAIIQWNIALRFIIYALLIFLIEYVAGFFTKKITGRCAWEYKEKYNIHGLINIPHFPFWGAAGLLLEIVHNYLLRLHI
jgi:uncharacterized membrane protein